MVIEHVEDVEKYLQEIYRVLKKGGIAYMGLPNRMFPMEPHTKIPLITYLPHRGFQKVVNAKARREYRINYISYSLMKEISAVGFKKTHDITRFFLKRGDQFYPSIPLFICRFLQRSYRILRFFIPTWVWVLRK